MSTSLHNPPDRRWLFWSLYLLFWTVVGLTFTLEIVVFRQGQGRSLGWGRALGMSLPDWYLWAGLSPAIYALSRRFPLSRRRYARSLAMHLPASVAFFFAYLVPVIALDYYLIWQPRPTSPFTTVLWTMTLRSAPLGLIVYWGIVAASHALLYYRRFRERELHASRLETQLVEARLQVLRMQLQPHFLFNTLHAVSALMHRDVDAAERMLIRLADLLRATLDEGTAREVPLREELRLLDLYLEIEKIRFGRRLTIEREIDPELLDARLPSLVLQPLVENCIKHGLGLRAEGGTICVRAQRECDSLLIEVEDDGPGLDEHQARRREGVGLNNTRRRLQQLYGTAQELLLLRGEKGGLVVRLRLPLGGVAAPNPDPAKRAP